jgi:hypothetical protein
LARSIQDFGGAGARLRRQSPFVAKTATSRRERALGSGQRPGERFGVIALRAFART